jgi:cysteinyl-tRNA synthetase
VRGSGQDLAGVVEKCRADFIRCMDDDLNISGGLGAVFDLVRDVNKALDQDAVGAEGAAAVLALLDELDAVTGILGDAPAVETPQAVLDLVQERQQARRNKDFARSDAIRDQLLAEGWVIEDTPDGPRVKRR